MSNTRWREKEEKWGHSLIARYKKNEGKNRCKKCNKKDGLENKNKKSRITISSYSIEIKGYPQMNRMRCRLPIWNLRVNPIKLIRSSSRIKAGRRGYLWIRVRQGNQNRIWCWMGIYLWCRFCLWKMGSFRILSDSRVVLWLIASRACRIWAIFHCWIWTMIIILRWVRRRRQSRRQLNDRKLYKQWSNTNRKDSKVGPLWTLPHSI